MANMNIRKTVVYPETIKTLSNGVEIITYYWQGAELAQIGDHGEVFYLIGGALAMGYYGGVI